jgi:hypothetical protein
MESETEVPSFCEAVNQLKSFLESRGLSTEIVWITREDVVWQPNCIYVKLPIPEENLRAAETA